MAGYLRPKNRMLNLPEFDLPLAISLPRRSYVPAVKVRPDPRHAGTQPVQATSAGLRAGAEYDPAEIERKIPPVGRA